MKRLNITIDSDLYEKARALAFIKRVSISQIIRTSLSDWLEKKNKIIEGILSEQDEDKLLKILENDEFIESDDVKSKLNI